jgi:hypothetical protein
MKKLLATVAAVGLLAAAAVSTSTEASAQWRHGGWGWGGVAAGVVGGAIIGSMIARTYGPQYVVEPGWAPYPAYAYGPPVGCPGGYWARKPIRFDAYGNPIRWSRPRYFCPEG